MPLTNAATPDLTHLRVAYYTDSGIMPATPETVAMVRAAAQVLAEAGAIVTEDQPSNIVQTLELFGPERQRRWCGGTAQPATGRH